MQGSEISEITALKMCSVQCCNNCQKQK